MGCRRRQPLHRETTAARARRFGLRPILLFHDAMIRGSVVALLAAALLPGTAWAAPPPSPGGDGGRRVPRPERPGRRRGCGHRGERRGARAGVGAAPCRLGRRDGTGGGGRSRALPQPGPGPAGGTAARPAVGPGQGAGAGGVGGDPGPSGDRWWRWPTPGPTWSTPSWRPASGTTRGRSRAMVPTMTATGSSTTPTAGISETVTAVPTTSGITAR